MCVDCPVPTMARMQGARCLTTKNPELVLTCTSALTLIFKNVQLSNQLYISQYSFPAFQTTHHIQRTQGAGLRAVLQFKCLAKNTFIPAVSNNT